MSETSVTKNEVGCRDDIMPKTVRKSQPYLAVPSCIYNFWQGVIPTSYFIFNPRCACPARVTVLGLCVSVCLLVLIYHFEQLRVQQGILMASALHG